MHKLDYIFTDKEMLEYAQSLHMHEVRMNPMVENIETPCNTYTNLEDVNKGIVNT